MTAATGSTLTVLTEQVTTVEATWDDARPVVPVEALPDLVGWELKAEGLCRADACVPLSDRAMVERPGGVDLLAIQAHRDDHLRHSIVTERCDLDPSAAIRCLITDLGRNIGEVDPLAT